MQKLIKFLKEGLWLKTVDPKKPVRSFFLRAFRVLYSAAVGFELDQCSLKASALTFYTLLSMVPVLAVAFGIAKGLGFEEPLQRQLAIQFKDNPEVANMATEFAYSFLKQAEGGIIAGIGILFLLWSVIKLLSIIEVSLNQIWKVRNSRSLARMISDYLAILIICPIFIVISSILTIYISSELRSLARNEYIGDIITPAIYITFKLIPLALSWLVLTLIYLIMPNTRVPLSNALVAGIVAGTAYQIVQWIYIYFQIGVSNYGAIYGSFAALPLFMLWVHVSWFIVLGGAEIAYSLECEKTMGAIKGARKMTSIRSLGVLLVHHCAEAFKTNQGAQPLALLAQDLGVTANALRGIAYSLIDAGILAKTQNHVENESFIVNKEVDKITIADVSRALDFTLHRKVSIIGSHALLSVEKKLQQWDAAAEDAAQNIPILEVAS